MGLFHFLSLEVKDVKKLLKVFAKNKRNQARSEETFLPLHAGEEQAAPGGSDRPAQVSQDPLRSW